MKSLTINDLKDNQTTVLFNEKPLTLVLEPDDEPIKHFEISQFIDA